MINFEIVAGILLAFALGWLLSRVRPSKWQRDFASVFLLASLSGWLAAQPELLFGLVGMLGFGVWSFVLGVGYHQGRALK